MATPPKVEPDLSKLSEENKDNYKQKGEDDSKKWVRLKSVFKLMITFKLIIKF